MTASLTSFIRLLLLMFLLPATVAAGEPLQIDVKITTHLGDQQKFVEGDRISFFLSLEQDAYIYLFYQDADANLLQLMPNQRMADHFFNQGLFMLIPSEQQPFQFSVSPPFGDELMYAFASDNSELKFAGDYLANGLKLLDITIERLTSAVKMGSDKVFGQSELLLKTMPREPAG